MSANYNVEYVTLQQQQATPLRFGFLLMPNYSMSAFTNAVEPLGMANRLSEKNLYEWPIITMDGSPVPANNGLIITPDYSIDEVVPLDIVFVCSGEGGSDFFSEVLQKYLCGLARQHVKLGELCTGASLLARSGLMNGYNCTVHWENMESMQEEFPQIRFNNKLYEIDRDRYTCAGGSAVLDMMFKLITNTHSDELTARISEQFMCDRIRGEDDHQRTPLQLQLGTGQPNLIEAVTLMEANIEEPISIDELSHLVGISRRQLERLFQRHLSCVPARYYLELRLDYARQLLLQTYKLVTDVSLACGFVSTPHFSKCYRDYFGHPPRDERLLKNNSHPQ